MSFDSEVGDCADYYFIYGGNADKVIANVRELTGQAPLYPLWALGFWQCRERYKSPDELCEVVDKYRKLKSLWMALYRIGNIGDATLTGMP